MSNENQIRAINLDGTEVPVVVPDGHIITGAVLLLSTRGIDEGGETEGGFYITSNRMTDVTKLGMIATADMIVREGLRDTLAYECEDDD